MLLMMKTFRVLHRNMLFPVQTVKDQSPTATTESVNGNRRPCSKLEISVTEHLVEVVDKLSTTAVVFFSS